MSALDRVSTAVKSGIKSRLTFIGSMVSVQTDRNEFALTFDDGPGPGGTDLLLPVLDKHGARATFFVLLTAARRHPALLQEIVAAGHEVALHGVDHRALTSVPHSDVVVRQQEGKAELEQLVGAPVRFMRPPYGSQSLRTWRATRAAGLTPALWGPTTWDWRDIPQTERIEHCLASLEPGAILLAHDRFADGTDGVDDGPGPVVDRVALIDSVLAGARERSLVARSLGDLLAVGRPVLSAVFSR
ncbi:polysaccharide deacetylase family protein [Nakamurella sp. A5-74]|uniref:Polysaccharide deacetylase family protein n=1 Tax=Nakamurella sp. A5-74 TaxID=3158264 RepID=A0AAU8DLS6_9ACTN